MAVPPTVARNGAIKATVPPVAVRPGLKRPQLPGFVVGFSRPIGGDAVAFVILVSTILPDRRYRRRYFPRFPQFGEHITVQAWMREI
jgi:hypothetical protein